MFTLFCYLFALIPVIVGVVLWCYNKRVVLWEVATITVVCFACAAIFNIFAIKGMTDDVETWSGKVISAVYQPEWEEYYEYAVYRTEYYTETVSHTDSDGRSYTTTETRSREVFDHWEPTSRTHNQTWTVQDTLVSTYYVDQNRYEDIKKKFGGTVSQDAGCRTTGEHNSRMIGGDPNDYTTINTTNHVYPVTTEKTWENRVKAAPSLFSFHKVSPTAPVFEYPSNTNRFSSNRLFGTANAINLYLWDQMNADLGPSKLVNVIACGFKDEDMGIALEQEAKWIGGKKNDLVICFGGMPNKPTWVYVFGWTEKDIVKRNIETMMLTNGLTNERIPDLINIIRKDYVIKNWSKFDYLTVEVPMSKYLWFILLITCVSSTIIIISLLNGVDKEINGVQRYNNVFRRSY
jgi:hypothetical protein